MASSNFADYAAQSPQSQGPQGQQGANQTPSPNLADYARGTSWTPPPSSQTGQGLSPNLADAASRGTQPREGTGITSALTNSPMTPSGGVNYQQDQRWATPQQPAQAPQSSPQGGQTSASVASSLSGGGYQAPQAQGGGSMPPTPDPFQGQGYWTGQQWVPKNHPLAQQNPNVPQPGGPGGVQPNPAPYSPYGPYPGRPDGTTFQPGQMPQQTFQQYQPTQFTGQAPSPYMGGTLAQWSAPNLGGMEGQQDQLMQQLLASGGSMGPDMVAQMKERQKQDALAMSQQQGTQMMQGAAARGALNGGATLAGQRNLGDQTTQGILGGYRDLDIAAAGQNYSDRLNALSASEQLGQGRFNQANQGYQNQLQGQMAQQGLNQQGFQNQLASAQFGLGQQQAQAAENQFGFGAQFQPATFNRDSFLAQQGLNQQGAASQLGAHQTDLDAFFQNQQLQNQMKLGQGGLDIDRQRLNQQDAQFGQSLDLDWANSLENMTNNRYQLGLNYAGLQQQAQNRMMQGLGF